MGIIALDRIAVFYSLRAPNSQKFKAFFPNLCAIFTQVILQKCFIHFLLSYDPEVMSKPNVIKPEMMKSYIWLQTADGFIEQVEHGAALFCPFIRYGIHAGMGSSRAHPISLPEQVNHIMLSLILDYCRFHHVPGRSNLERKSFDEKFIRMDTKSLCKLATAADNLKLRPLVDLTRDALEKVIVGKTEEEIREAFGLPDDLTEEEKLQAISNPNDDPHIRLLNKLYARKRKELKEKLKEVEVAAKPVDDRSVDDLLSFINGENGDSKEATTSKKKKKNRRRKDKPKNALSVCTISDNSVRPTSVTKESACHDMVKGNCQAITNEALNLQDTETVI